LAAAPLNIPPGEVPGDILDHFSQAVMSRSNQWQNGKGGAMFDASAKTQFSFNDVALVADCSGSLFLCTGEEVVQFMRGQLAVFVLALLFLAAGILAY